MGYLLSQGVAMRNAFLLFFLVAACQRSAPATVDAASAEAAPQTPAPQAPPPELVDLFWSSVSEGGGKAIAEVRQTATARNSCHVVAALGDEKRWSVDACLATRLELRFVSSDAASLMVLDPSPDSDDLTLAASIATAGA